MAALQGNILLELKKILPACQVTVATNASANQAYQALASLVNRGTSAMKSERIKEALTLYMQIYFLLSAIVYNKTMPLLFKQGLFYVYRDMHNDIYISENTQSPALSSIGDSLFDTPPCPPVEYKHRKNQQKNELEIYVSNQKAWEQYSVSTFGFSHNNLYFVAPHKDSYSTIHIWNKDSDLEQHTLAHTFDEDLEAIYTGSESFFIGQRHETFPVKRVDFTKNPQPIDTRIRRDHIYSNNQHVFCKVSGGKSIEFFYDDEPMQSAMADPSLPSRQIYYVSISPDGEKALIVYLKEKGGSSTVIVRVILDNKTMKSSDELTISNFPSTKKITWFSDSENLFFHDAKAKPELYHATFEDLISFNKVKLALPPRMASLSLLDLYLFQCADNQFNAISSLYSTGIYAVKFRYDAATNLLTSLPLMEEKTQSQIFTTSLTQTNRPISECKANHDGSSVAVRSGLSLKVVKFNEPGEIPTDVALAGRNSALKTYLVYGERK